MGGSAKAPKQSASQTALERAQVEALERQKAEAEAKSKEPPILPSAPLPPPAPPVNQSSADTAQAEEAARRAALRRTNASRGTLFAGETGGYRAGALGGQKTLLG